MQSSRIRSNEFRDESVDTVPQHPSAEHLAFPLPSLEEPEKKAEGDKAKE